VSSQRLGCLGFFPLLAALGVVEGFLGGIDLSSVSSAGWVGARRVRVAGGLTSFSTDTGADIERAFPAKRAFGVLFAVVSALGARGGFFAGCVLAAGVLSMPAGVVFLVGLGGQFLPPVSRQKLLEHRPPIFAIPLCVFQPFLYLL
jgi:hypothetical protein